MRRAVSALQLVAARARPRRVRSHGRIEPDHGSLEHETRAGGWLRRRVGRGRSVSADGDGATRSGARHFAWLELPEALRFHIVSFLDRRSIAALACVSTSFRVFAGSDVVWRRLYRETFRSPPPKSHASLSPATDTVTVYASSGPGRLRSATAPSSMVAAAAAAARSGSVGGVPPWHVPPRRRTPRNSADGDLSAATGTGGGRAAQAAGGSHDSTGGEPSRALARRLSGELAAVAPPPHDASAAAGVGSAGGGAGTGYSSSSAVVATQAQGAAAQAGGGATPAAASLPGMVVATAATGVVDAGADAGAGEAAAGAGAGAGAVVERGATPLLEWMQQMSWRPVNEFAQFHNYQSLFKERLEDPAVGDGVQVLWEGSFNLVSANGITGYEGRAWWEAAVVDKDGDEYKIHYPQWDSALWDEWVTRDRIRWPPTPETDPKPLLPGDVVEMRCTSSSGRSPWLESVVLRVDGERYYVGNVVITGDKSVSRKALRFVRRPPGASRHRSSLHLGRHRCVVM